MARKTDMTGTTLSNSPAPPPPAAVVPPPHPDEATDAAVAQSPPLERRRRLRDDPRVPSFLISTIVHTVLLVVLALLTYQDETHTAATILVRQGPPDAVVTLQPIEQQDLETRDDGALAEQPVNVVIAPAPRLRFLRRWNRRRPSQSICP